MCEHSFNPPEVLDMPFDIATKIIDEFAEKGESSIKFVYVGEPLLYKRLPEIIQYAKEKGIYDTIIATNASLLDYEISKRLITAGLDWITYSVDSCQPEIYKQIRINGNLKIVTRNIRGFYDVRNMLESKTPKIVIQAIRQDLNREELDRGKYHAFWKPYVDEIRISHLEDYTNKTILPEGKDFRCNSPFQRLTIRADGNITMCCGERSEEKIFGNIRENTIEEIWLGSKFNEVRNQMLEGKAHLNEACQKCSMFRSYHERKNNKI